MQSIKTCFIVVYQCYPLSMLEGKFIIIIHSRTVFSINIVHEPSYPFIRCQPFIDKKTVFVDNNKNTSLIYNKGVRIQTFTLSPFTAFLYPRTGRLFSCFIRVYTAYYQKIPFVLFGYKQISML